MEEAASLATPRQERPPRQGKALAKPGTLGLEQAEVGPRARQEWELRGPVGQPLSLGATWLFFFFFGC